MKNKFLLSAIMLLIISMFIYNYFSARNDKVTENSGMLFIIVLASVLCVFYIFYSSNKTLYEELASRMDQIIDSKNELQATFDGISYAMVEMDLEGNIINFNKVFRKYIADKENVVMGKSFIHVMENEFENIEEIKLIISNALNTGTEIKAQFVQGKKYYNFSVFPIKNSREKTTKVLVIIQDITKEKATERQMLQDNKMIAVGQLAAGVAHEIRNPLGLIRNYCYVLKNSDTMNEKAIEIIEKAVDKSGKIIENLLNFSRISSENKKVINLKQHIKSVLLLHRSRAEESHISLTLECDDCIQIYVLTESLELVLINLLLNAMDAIETKNENFDDNSIRIHCISDHENVIIIVEDTGEGIPEDIQDDIFNPFFTTKEKRDGNGLGLYIVYNEVKKMNGEISVESATGKGTKFTLKLPNPEVINDDIKNI